jgi:hypothetical protein
MIALFSYAGLPRVFARFAVAEHLHAKIAFRDFVVERTRSKW